MGNHHSKPNKSQSATKSDSSNSSLKRVSRLFQPGLKRDQRATDSTSSSPQPTKGEVAAASQLSVGGQPESEVRPAEVANDQAEDTNAMSSTQTVPCQYRTGKTLGSGTYAIVKEAVHIKTGTYYACKVINKKLMEGREHMVRNEIAVLKKISKSHPNIVTLHDYFETAHNLYLCFDLCTGGELFDRICAKGNYYEKDAADLVRTIFGAVAYLHKCGIVHRDLKPENLLFRDPSESADIMICDFGLSRVIESDKMALLTEICGTPGYMAPEIFLKSGHHKPVDVWAMGVITYFLLCGYTPFDRDSQAQETEAIIAGDYKFEPAEYWENVSEPAKEFIRCCLTGDPTKRPNAQSMLEHKWLSSKDPHYVTDSSGGAADLLPQVKKNFDAKKTFRKAVFTMMAMKRMSTLAALSPGAEDFDRRLQKYKEESEKEAVDENEQVFHHGGPAEGKKARDSASSPKQPQEVLSAELSKLSVNDKSKAD